MGYIFEKSHSINRLEDQSAFLCCSLPPPSAVTARARHRPRVSGHRWDPTRGPREPARPAPGSAGPCEPAAARGTRAAGPALGAAYDRAPPAPPTRGLTADGPAPGSALGALVPAGRAAPPPHS